MGQPKSSEIVRGEEPVMLMLGGLLVFFPLQQTETSAVFSANSRGYTNRHLQEHVWYAVLKILDLLIH